MLFGFTETELADRGAAYTAKEIAQQPNMWLKTLKIVDSQCAGLREFIGQVTNQKSFDILMVGAGTSNYVGESACEALNVKLPYRIRSCGSTDLVVEPEKYLAKDRPTLLVSFARSGNSPESVGAVEMANQICKQVHHLFITCNSQGKLAKLAKGKSNYWSLELPPETNDQGFAMTSSFSSMYLATLAIFQLDHLPEIRTSLEKLCAAAGRLIHEDWTVLKDVVDIFNFDRIVYLGTGALRGIAQESALKMLELNAGKVATFFESPLGFRHGPKSILNSKTLTVFYLSSNSYIRHYEMDLVRELSEQRHKNRLMTISVTDRPELKSLVDDYHYFFKDDELDDEYAAMLDVTTAQIIALLKSIKNGVKPDDPCPTGEVNRVVKGVVIYPYALR
jgi:agaS protein